MIPAQLTSIISSIFLRQAGGNSQSIDDRMDSQNYSIWETADNRTNGDPFNNGWRSDKVIYRNGTMSLRLDRDGCPIMCSGRPYVSGEIRTKSRYGYGLFEVRMKAAKGDGLISSFFTFYAPPTNQYKYNDEIDVEIFGKDPTIMQINYFNDATTRVDNPNGILHKKIHLGFDASEGFHNYAILWTPKSISWYVDGRLIHTENGSKGRLPTKPAQIMMNLWPGINHPDINAWLGRHRYSGPVSAQYDWVRYIPLNRLPATGLPKAPPSTPAPIPGPAPSPGPSSILLPQFNPPTTIATRGLPFGVPDPMLGKVDAYGRPQLNRVKVEKYFTLPQLEAVINELARAPVNRILDHNAYLLSTTELNHRYPELARLRRLDRGNTQKLYWYFRDFRTYWDNAILLFSVYVQKITESTSLDKQVNLHRALAIVKKFKMRIDTQLAADQAVRKMRTPSSYNMAALKLTQAELHAQIENRDELFYETGIELAVAAIKDFRSLELDTLNPSKPDYYSIIKGIVLLGDLYNRLSSLTQRSEHYQMAAYLYNKVIDLNQNDNSLFSLDLPEHDLAINIYPQDIEEGLDFNIDQSYITADDKRLALVGIYHQLRGMALLKSAAFYAARPMYKNIDDIFNQFSQSIYGMIELRDAAAMANLPDIKNRFFYTQAKIIQGELLMLLADRVNYFHFGMGRPDIPEPTVLLDALSAAKNAFPEEARFEALKNEIPVLEANQIIATARIYYFTDIPRYYRYLYAQSVVKELEISIRNGEFVHPMKYLGGTIRVVDAEALLAFCAKHRPRIEALARDKIIPEYIKIEFDYLEAILQLTGISPKYKNGKYKITRIRYYNPLRTLQLIQQVEASTPMIPDVSGVPLEINVALKEAAVFIQIEQGRSKMFKELREHPVVLNRILKKSGKKMSLAEYALWILRRVEKRTAPILPPYLIYNTEVTFRQQIKKWNPEKIKKITDVLKIFIEDNVKVYHPSGYKEIRTKFDALRLQIRRKNKTESLAALDVFIKAIKKLDANSKSFIASYADINAWDMETLRAELYHTMATVYGILKKGHHIQQYVQSAYLAAARSSSLYDQEHRPAFIFESTKIAEDTDIPLLKISVQQRNRQLRQLGRQR